jgi:hypothetical protein
VWHEATKAARERGDLVLLGVIQEQHANRCRLFAQWQEFDWPIVQDPFNKLGLRAVPIPVAIDEAGIVVSTRMKISQLAGFLSKPPPTGTSKAIVPARPDLVSLKTAAARDGKQAWQEFGDALMLFGADDRVTDAINAYNSVDAGNPRRLNANGGRLLPADLHFRVGVALRRRFDSKRRKPGDFQAAVDAWSAALDSDPNHYIYRRRIEQYGPRLIKPYPFYDWVEAARKAVIARGETPVSLSVEPSGAEIAMPSKRFVRAVDINRNPDPDGKIDRDNRYVKTSIVVVPGRIKAGESVRIHIRMSPTESAKWNNEVEATKVWLNLPDKWQTESHLLSTALPKAAESTEERRFEVEFQSPKNANGKTIITGYALYYICENGNGQCLYRRQNFQFSVEVR